MFFSYNFGKIKIDSDNDLPVEETPTLHNIIIHMKSALNKNQNHYYYNIFFKEGRFISIN